MIINPEQILPTIYLLTGIIIGFPIGYNWRRRQKVVEEYDEDYKIR